MASFRKIGGRTRNMNINKAKVEPQPNDPPPANHEMHIAQIELEQNQSVFYPLMSDNETPRYFEDAGLYYCFNQTVQDFVLNADYISATNIFNVDTLVFADGSVMSSASEPKKEQDIYNRYIELDNEEETQQIVLPTCGVYLITFSLNLGDHLIIKLNESCFTQTHSGCFTIHYDEQFTDDSLNKTQTSSSCLDFTFTEKNDERSKTGNSHVTITRIS